MPVNKWSLTREYIQSVVKQENLVIRNLRVTQGYYRLSQGMKRYATGSNVNWCAFATHASKTAGQALRHELMPRFLRSAMIRLAGYDDTFVFLNEGIREPGQTTPGRQNGRLGKALVQVSQLISDGNITVFKELAYPFAAFIETFKKNWVYDEDLLQTLLKQNFRPGPLSAGGQDYLIEAFTAYYKARFSTQAEAKAEYVLQANLLIGLHEQTRLQPQIEQAMAVPINLFKEKPQRGIRARLDPLSQDESMSRKIVARAITEMMMSITLPSRELKLGQNIIAPTGIASYPQELLLINNPRCLELVRMFEQGQDTLTGSAADDWASLGDRMSFVVDFFRSHQKYKRMWEMPFLPEQVPVIESGHFPAGPL